MWPRGSMNTESKTLHFFNFIKTEIEVPGPTSRMIPEIKKKKRWKQRSASHRWSVSATGWGKGTVELSPLNTRITSILVETGVCDIFSERDGDTDITETTDEPVTALFCLLFYILFGC